MSDTPDLTPDDNVLAAEYVLGLLGPEERAAAEEKLGAEPEFRALTAFWEEELARLAEGIPLRAPSPAVKRVIDRALFETTTATSPSFWERIGFWRGATAVMTGLSAVLLGVVMTSPDRQPPEPQPVYMAALTASDAPLSVLIRINAREEILTVKPFDIATDGRVTELWLIAGDAAPSSLGLISPEDGSVVELASIDISTLGPDTLLAISLEPEGGSPTGQPTGPVVAIGKLQVL
ncbi:anti-sigma factor domain-containing protein [Parvularcula sp. LCG005]|uniref:anti-sigma factor n=1 Tax=Parvularcula sp. LCG005 TaxID=3078805 RepID=UPI002941BF31|nr:anti-sigma factor [Parvularcula sp. LCG005]WOI54356.1 anti-sigma factor [Parvularcula sp. LCG005]